jgi:hypothetical protein
MLLASAHAAILETEFRKLPAAAFILRFNPQIR